MSGPGAVLWSPPAHSWRTPLITRYLDWLAQERGVELSGYEQLWRWSVADLEGFWGSVWEFFSIRAHPAPKRVLASREMPGAVWFPETRLNYAEHACGASDEPAIIAHSDTRGPLRLSFADLHEQVARARVGLERLGVGRGDCVAAYLPNIPETVIAFLAAASLGAVWCSCAPELGPRSVIDRLASTAPRVLLAIAGYRYGDRVVDRCGEVAEVVTALGSVEHVVHVPYLGGEADALEGALGWEDLLSESAPLTFAQVPFEHPLYVLFSSGTTGPPKAIVHCHGGILVEHLKNHGLSWDLQPGDRLMWFTTTSWMMWNALVSALLCRASIVAIDGNPVHPDLTYQWRLAEQTRPTVMGAGPAWLMACRKAGVRLADYDLSSLRQLGAAGSPLPAEGFDWVYEQLGPDVLLNVGSGGTDVCTGIVQGGPLQPVLRGEISGSALAVDAAAFDAHGRPVVGQLGELVIRSPMPSMPVGLCNDADGSRYRAAYFEHFPGVWRHGDWIIFTERGSCVVTGRSDATLNRGGVRLGTGEFYSVLEALEEIEDSLVVHLEDTEGGPGELILLLQLAPGIELSDELRRRVALVLRGALSPRHVPDTLHAVAAIPKTLNGKKLELPVKRVFLGARPEDVAARDALADPTALDTIAALASERATVR